MIEFFFPNSRALLPTFHTSCPYGSHFAHMGSHLPRIPPQTPILYSAITKPFGGHVSTQKNPNPAPKHPFFWLEVESVQNELQSGQNGPQLGKMFEKWAKLF